MYITIPIIGILVAVLIYHCFKYKCFVFVIFLVVNDPQFIMVVDYLNYIHQGYHPRSTQYIDIFIIAIYSS